MVRKHYLAGARKRRRAGAAAVSCSGRRHIRPEVIAP